ncbi:MAG TPA: MFS transporter [Bryobacteraceae bacterium]|jgi:MFS family permease
MIPTPSVVGAPVVSRRWIVVGLLFLGMVVSYIDRGNLSIAAGSIMRDFGIAPDSMGMLMSAFFWTYGLFQIPAGTLIDRVGIRWIYAFAFLTWSLASAGIAISHGATDIFALRLLLGLAEAAGPIASMTYIRQNFDGPEQGLPTAIYIAAQNLGPAAGSWIGSHLIESMGWRFMFGATSLGALLWLPLWLWFGPRSSPRRIKTEKPAPATASVGSMPLAGLLAMSSCILFASYFWYFLLSWVPTYLTSTRGFSTTQMGSIFAIPFVVMAVVNTISGRVADRLAARLGVLRVRVLFASVAFASASLVLLLLVAPSQSAVLPLLIVAVTGFGIGSANFWALAQFIPPGAMVGRAVGYLNTLSQIAGALAPSITGWILGPEKNFTVALAIAGVCPVIAAGCLLAAGPSGLAAVKKHLEPVEA